MSKGVISQSKRIKKIEKKLNKVYELIEGQMPKVKSEEPYYELFEDLNIENKIREFLDLYIEYPSISETKLEISSHRIGLRGSKASNGSNGSNNSPSCYFNLYIEKNYLTLNGNIFDEHNNTEIFVKSTIWNDYLDKLKMIYKEQNQKMFDEGFKKMLDISNLNRGKGLKDLDLD